MTIKNYPSYETTPHALSLVGVNSLANGATYAFDSVDNSNPDYRFDDIQFQMKIKSGVSGVSASGAVNVHLYTSLDNIHWQGNYGGIRGSTTMTVPPNAILVESCNAVANATDYVSSVFSLGYGRNNRSGLFLPKYWAVSITNETEAALDTDSSNFWFAWIGVRGISEEF